MKIAVTICATESYTYAMADQARRVQASLMGRESGDIILVGTGKTLEKFKKMYEELVPGWKVHVLNLTGLGEHKNYQEDAQLVIGQMRTAAFCKARSLGVDYCWSLDSDVLPPPNALGCLLNAVEFDQGYYSIAMVTYPSQGGGGFLGGFGTHRNHILPDFYEEERELPDELKKELDEVRSKLKEAPTEAIHKRHGELAEKIRQCPPKGPLFKMIHEFGWKQRGWMENAYPGIGKGSMVPTKWVGFGCTLMNKRALNQAYFDGYDGKGTEDLYIGWKRWHPEGLRMAVITHIMCDHVVRKPHNRNEYVLCQAYHEVDGECEGHIRLRHLPWYPMDPGVQFDPKNNGMLSPPVPSKVEGPTKEEPKPEATPV